jgi:molybdopterin converting factor small subunit
MIMQVRIKCFATLSDHTPAGGVLTLPAGGTVESALKGIGLAPGDVKLVFVNGKHAEMDSTLADGDQLGVFPAVGGG